MVVRFWWGQRNGAQVIRAVQVNQPLKGQQVTNRGDSALASALNLNGGNNTLNTSWRASINGGDTY